MSPAERQRSAAEQKRCQNCLGKHTKDSCLSDKRCFKCHAGHHTLLHEAHASPVPPSSFEAKTGENQSLACTGQSSSVTNVITTAKFIISSPLTRETLMVRFIIDSGASDSYFTSRCAQHLRLKPTKCASSVTGLGQTAVPVDGVVKINVHARDRKVAFYGHPVYVVKRITGSVPSLPLSKEVRVAVSKVPLADDSFADPGEVDGLLGADLFPRILNGQNFSFGPSAPMGLNTIFGVILIGPTSCEPANRESSAAVALLTHSSFCDKLERFWELEEVPTSKRLSADEELAEKIYTETTVQQSNWRYMVRLPFKPNPAELGSSRTQAQSQFASLDRRFAKDPNFHAQYVSFMEEYLANGYMSEVDPHSQEAATGYYLPRHGVLRDSTTTRLRVVFNASAPSSNGVSLNDILLPGVPLQKDIRDILLDFRRHAVVFTADIKQMFLQVDLHPDDRKYQLILWRKSPDEPLKIYSLNTVTFGVSSSPFLSIRTLLRLADEYGHLYPRAAEVLRKTVFVDDILGGDKSAPLAKQRLDEIIELLRLGGFVPRKFTSNAKILSSYPVEDLAPPKLDDPDNPRHSILGLDWISTKDCFTYLTNPRPHLHTKRGVLSQIAAIYDPCGWIAPVHPEWSESQPGRRRSEAPSSVTPISRLHLARHMERRVFF
ncbi:uncharacterized protein [Bemisia tabaci]|uniref:uncharacterized protein n=1 Tax=Bemisia tabaci TaxID=7038 RepID=UPI003B28B832